MSKELKEQIRDLEKEIEIKDQELDRAQKELLKVNSALEKMILDLNQELKLAGHIQKFLSPTELPNITGVEMSSKFIPGTRFGGDYFDIFEHEDKLKFGILLASSSGYAMSALFLSVLIKLSAQIEARRGADPDNVIQLMASELVPNIQNDDQASVFYGVVDRRTFEFKYSSIGGVIAFHQLHGSEKINRLVSTAKALGKNYSGTPVTNKILLGPRDKIILCSEGVESADFIAKSIVRGPSKGVHELRNEILFQVSQKNDQKDAVRDQTVIVTEVKDRVIKLAQK